VLNAARKFAFRGPLHYLARCLPAFTVIRVAASSPILPERRIARRTPVRRPLPSRTPHSAGATIPSSTGSLLIRSLRASCSASDRRPAI